MTNSRITKITLENFKGIGERTEIPIAPLTLLFGGNSAGKSTILHAIAYADEVLHNQNCNVDTTRLGGESLRLGGFYEIVHKHDLNATIKMRFDLNMDKFDEYEDFLIKKLNIVPKARNDSDMQDNAEKGGTLWSEVFRENVNKWIDQEIGGNIKSAWVELEIGYSAKYDPTKKLGPMVLSYNIGLNDEWFAEVGMCSWKEACGGEKSVTKGKR
jgi:predicted ATPase